MKKTLLSLLLVFSSLSSCYLLDEFNHSNEEKEENNGSQNEGSNFNTDKPSDEVKKYKISWEIDGKVVRTDDVEEGKLPTYGSNPTKSTSNTTKYTFDRWEPTITNASKDITYSAIFTEEERKYNISFEIHGTVVDSSEYSYNATPVFSNPDNIIDSDNVYHINGEHYRFDGWNPSIGPVTKDQKYVANTTKVNQTVYYHFNCYNVFDYERDLYTLLSPDEIRPLEFKTEVQTYLYNSETGKMDEYVKLLRNSTTEGYRLLYILGNKSSAYYWTYITSENNKDKYIYTPAE